MVNSHKMCRTSTCLRMFKSAQLRHPVQHQQYCSTSTHVRNVNLFQLRQAQFPQKLQRVNMSSNVQNCALEATFAIPPEIAARDHVLGMALLPNEARRSNATKIPTCQHVFERGHFPIEEDMFSWWELSPWCSWILAPAQRRCISPNDASIS